MRRHLRDRAISIYQSMEDGSSRILGILAKEYVDDDADDFRTAVTCTDIIINSDPDSEIIAKAYRIQVLALLRLDRLPGAQDCIEAFRAFAENRGSTADRIASHAMQAELYDRRGLYFQALI